MARIFTRRLWDHCGNLGALRNWKLPIRYLYRKRWVVSGIVIRFGIRSHAGSICRWVADRFEIPVCGANIFERNVGPLLVLAEASGLGDTPRIFVR